jgi:transposase
MVESRKQSDVKQVLEGWGSEVLQQIVEVSIDLSGNYKGLVHKVLPNADIVADRFHVMKLVNQELNVVRNAVIKAAKDNQNQSEKPRFLAALNHSKYALLKPEEQLTQKQQIKLSEVKAVSPLLANMHQQKEAFRAIFETAENWTDGTLRLLDWLAKAQESFQKSVGTICRWFGEVVAYFENRTTSGAVEGINNKLKLIKRSGYGFRNFENFQLRCLICWHLDTSSA